MLELYDRISYFIGTNRAETRRIGRKIVKEKFVIKVIYQGGGQFFIENLCMKYNPNHVGEE